ncbi:putative spermidine/putrescine transport system substrate-binding protein [Nocardioides thalensis]|uniref:Putative spermidine/putrescine transport system substrate-binding protein n=1 Tax=Nocardioides thalensis TaxID=1914755 RepID=A0A853C6U6_9ACTN|nr:ABC transporter substrate-binding protein [Nocardioides thalensis]NYJ02198.1 putative spermidine/putrescine transport system substrate-binding protein [Nocardioides thalensis]
MRRVLTAGVTLMTVSALAACGAAGSGDEQLTVVMWGGADQKTHVEEAVEPWAEDAGVTVKQDSPSDYAKFRAQVESGNVSWDVVEVEPNFAHTACEKGWAEKLDTEVVDTSELKAEEVTDCAIPVLEYAFTIGYNTETFPGDHPTTWAEFFDTEKFPGKRGFWKYATGAMFEAALLADGVAPEDLYPLDIDRAFEKLDTIKDDIVFYETGEQQQQLVASGEAPLVQAWNGRIFSAAQEGQPVANEWNEHLLSYDQLVIPKGAPNADQAMDWMAWYVDHPEAQAGYANETGYGPITEDAVEHIDEDVLSELPTSPENAAKRAAIVDYAWWADNYDEVTERLNEWAAQ